MPKVEENKPLDSDETQRRTWFEHRLRERMEDADFFLQFAKAKSEIDAADVKAKAKGEDR